MANARADTIQAEYAPPVSLRKFDHSGDALSIGTFFVSLSKSKKSLSLSIKKPGFQLQVELDYVICSHWQATKLGSVVLTKFDFQSFAFTVNLESSFSPTATTSDHL